MKKLGGDFKKGSVKLKVESLDDLWYLSQIIDIGDLVRVRLLPRGKFNEGIIASINEDGLGFAEPIVVYYVLLHGSGETIPCIAGELEKI